LLDFSVTFLITIANLAILVLVLRKLLWKPVTDFMDARSRKVREELEGAAASRARAEELEARYESLLANAEAEGEWVVKDAEDRAREEYRRIVASAEADAAAIRVMDDGPGIPGDLRRRIFEPGITTKSSGWGIGLALARRVVEDSHGGELLLESSEPGATFLIRIPMHVA